MNQANPKPALMVIGENSGFTPEQVDIIKSQICPKGTTDAELGLFLMYCQKTGLDPFARQIYLSERKSKDSNNNWTVTRKPETTIDGFRLIAERTDKYRGQIGPQWCGEDGVWTDVWLKATPPLAARIGILRGDFSEPLYSVSLYREYVQTTTDGNPNSMWRKMPANQLAKCAESGGLRRAFPRELSGMYTDAEMGQAENEDVQPQTSTKAPNPYLVGLLPEGQPAPAQAQQTQQPLQAAPQPAQPQQQPVPHPPAQTKALDPEVMPAKPAAPKADHGEFSMSKMIQKFAEQRARIGDAAYYHVLGTNGLEHSNQLRSREEAAPIYKELEARPDSQQTKAERAKSPLVQEISEEVLSIARLYDKKSTAAVKKLLDAFLSGYYGADRPKTATAENIKPMRVVLGFMRQIMTDCRDRLVENATRAQETGKIVSLGVHQCASYLGARPEAAKDAFWDMAISRYPDSGGADAIEFLNTIQGRMLSDEDFIAVMSLLKRSPRGIGDFVGKAQAANLSIAKIVASWSIDLAVAPVAGIEALFKQELQAVPAAPPAAEEQDEDPFGDSLFNEGDSREIA